MMYSLYVVYTAVYYRMGLAIDLSYVIVDREYVGQSS